MKKSVKTYALVAIGILVGATAGYFYWSFIGCDSGGCAITSDPLNSTLYGSVMGGLVFSLFKKEKKEEI